jgi:tetratricopeptide (TPR) repeat protein
MYASPAESMPKAKAAAQKALELDESLAEAHASMGTVLMAYDWNWSAAGRELKRAIELKPSYAWAHQVYGGYLGLTGQPEDGMAEVRKAYELDPMSLSISLVFADGLRRSGQVDASIAQYEKIVEWEADDSAAYSALARIYYDKGMQEESLEALKKASALRGWEGIAEALDNADRTSGYQGAWREVAGQLAEHAKTQYFSPAMIADMYVRASEKDEAIQWLETAYEQRDPRIIGLKDTGYDPLRSDPRFQDIVRRMNFPQ